MLLFVIVVLISTIAVFIFAIAMLIYAIVVFLSTAPNMKTTISMEKTIMHKKKKKIFMTATENLFYGIFLPQILLMWLFPHSTEITRTQTALKFMGFRAID